MGLLYAQSFLLLLLLSIVSPVLSDQSQSAPSLVNVTIDDTYGDPITLNQFTYSSRWAAGQGCDGCSATGGLDPSKTFRNSWHDAHPTSDELVWASIIFTGSAVYVQCILVDAAIFPPNNTRADYTFFMNGSVVGTYTEKNPTNEYIYNFTVYSNTSMAYGTYNLTVQSGHIGGATQLILLDSVIYSYDPSLAHPSPPARKHSNVGAIAGGVVGGVALLVLGAGALILFRRRQRRSSETELAAATKGPHEGSSSPLAGHVELSEYNPYHDLPQNTGTATPARSPVEEPIPRPILPTNPSSKTRMTWRNPGEQNHDHHIGASGSHEPPPPAYTDSLVERD